MPAYTRVPNVPPNAYDPNVALFQCNGFLNPSVVPVQQEYGPAAPPCPPTASVSTASVADEPAAPDEPPCKHRYWLSASYAAIFIQPQKLAVPLLTTGSLADADPGAIDQPGTVVVSGNQLNFGMLSGVQTDAGVFLESDGSVALQWSSVCRPPMSLGSPRCDRQSAHCPPVFNANRASTAPLSIHSG